VGSQLFEWIGGQIRSPSSQQVPEQTPEGVHFSGGASLGAATDQLGGNALVTRHGKRAMNRNLRMGRSDETSVDNLDAPLRSEQQVPHSQIAVESASEFEPSQSIQSLAGDLSDDLCGKAATPNEQLVEWLPRR